MSGEDHGAGTGEPACRESFGGINGGKDRSNQGWREPLIKSSLIMQKGMAVVSAWGELSVGSEERAASQQDGTPLSAEQAVID